MKFSKFRTCFLILAVATLFFAAAKPARADSYEVFDLGSGNHRELVGIEASGAVVFYTMAGSCGGGVPCWETFVDGIETAYSMTNPNPVYDNGMPCTPAAPAAFSGFIPASVCNNGHEVYGTNMFAPFPYEESIFTGSDPVADYFSSGVLAEAFLNSTDDFVYLVNQLGESPGEYYEATATPDPASILLTGTGVLGVFWAMRRRWFLSR